MRFEEWQKETEVLKNILEKKIGELEKQRDEINEELVDMKTKRDRIVFALSKGVGESTDSVPTDSVPVKRAKKPRVRGCIIEYLRENKGRRVTEDEVVAHVLSKKPGSIRKTVVRSLHDYIESIRNVGFVQEGIDLSSDE